MSSPAAGAALAGLERLLAAGKDGPLLRFGIGNEYLKLGNAEAAATHLRRAVELDPTYSAAWKMLGRALASTHRDDEAYEGEANKEALMCWHGRTSSS